jgi:hypothetical protein
MFPLAPSVYIKTLQISFQDLKLRGIYKESCTDFLILSKMGRSDHRGPGFSSNDHGAATVPFGWHGYSFHAPDEHVLHSLWVPDLEIASSSAIWCWNQGQTLGLLKAINDFVLRIFV